VRVATLCGLLVLVALAAAAAPPPPPRQDFAAARQQMVSSQIEHRGVTDGRVLQAMQEVPRHLFVPESLREKAYDDSPLPIGEGQTISQPYIVALMTSLLELGPQSRVLEIGTGSGYQAAVLSRLAKEVYSMEILPPLAEQARKNLEAAGCRNVSVRVGDGYKGWPEEAPFDAVVVTAAPEQVPQPLIDQLRVGGRMVIPVGSYFQNLLLITKTADGLEKRTILPVRFVPMTGEVQKQ
jgi:protein-L-isoaspartate(D-aspartate) O-methyltransferase